MSRIGKVPVVISEKVEIKMMGQRIHVKGPRGHLECSINPLMDVAIKAKEIIVTPTNESKECKQLWGTTRTIINNMVVGVTLGFTKTLEFNGVGYKVAVSGKNILLNLGHSHPIDFRLPDGIEAKVNKNCIDIIGADKELVGFVAAKIRSFRPTEPYKGKGLRYSNETVVRKAGKAGAKK